jgi:hypothetical protein
MACPPRVGMNHLEFDEPQDDVATVESPQRESKLGKLEAICG